RRCASRLPAICETRGTPYLSRRIWPMMLGGFPSLESLRTRASISSGSYLNQEGGRLLTGRVEPELPLFPEYMRAMVSDLSFPPFLKVGRCPALFKSN